MDSTIALYSYPLRSIIHLNGQLQNRQTHLRRRIRHRLLSHQITQEPQSQRPLNCSHQTSLHLSQQRTTIITHPPTTPQTQPHRIHLPHLQLELHHQHRHGKRQVRPIHLDSR